MVGSPLVVHYWADLQSVHEFRCYDNIAPNAKCQWVLVFALCLVNIAHVTWHAKCTVWGMLHDQVPNAVKSERDAIHVWQLGEPRSVPSQDIERQRSAAVRICVHKSQHSAYMRTGLQRIMLMTHAPETGARKLASVSGAGFSRQLQNFWRQKPTRTNNK